MTHRSERRFLPILFVGLVCGMIAPVGAATLEVDDSGGTPYATIQAAIDAAVPGVDSVLVRCGVYVENITMKDGVPVVGEGAQCTFIDGNANGTSAVTIVNTGPTTVLEGFTIRNGQSALGGGILIIGASPQITNNVIEGNAAVDTGALSGYGGGIQIQSPIALRATTAPVITGNVIRNNSAAKFGGGVEIYLGEGVRFENNLVVGNTATQGGGGIDVFFSLPYIINNTIVRNCLQGGATACSQGGGGVSLTDSDTFHFRNNVIAWNEAASGGGGVDFINSNVIFQNNDGFGNVPSNYAPSDPPAAFGNISVDPLFDDESATLGGFQPRSDSPLVDAGSSNMAPGVDARGIPRPRDGDASGVAQFDIGARENEGVTGLVFGDAVNASWDPSVDTLAGFNLYRGDLQELVALGIYNQNPMTLAGARQWCALAAASVADTDTPDPGQIYFYLAVVDGTTEGELGFDSTPQLRAFTDPGANPDAARCP